MWPQEFADLPQAVALAVDVPFPVLGIEPLQGLDLGFGELQLPLPGGLLQSQQPLMLRFQAVPAPHAPDPTRAHLHALQQR